MPVIFVLLLGCSRSKDTFTSRVYHQMVSQFNPLFNGEQALLKGKKSLRNQHSDNYDKVLPVFPIGDEDAAVSVKPDMDKAVEKATKVIQRHSMMIRNDQKNRFIDDSYLLMGKARYYKREYLEALETFNYLIQEFPHSKLHDEAVMWAAKTETALGNYLGAKEKFEKIYRNEELSRKLRAKVFASYAQLEIKRGNKTVGYQLLEQAVDKSRSKEDKVRWLFIMGQLQARLGNEYEASQLFRKVIRKGPPYELLFEAQLARARNYDVDMQNPEKAFDELESMLKDDKNYDNRDKIYYAMAEIAEKMDDEALMEDYLKKSIRASTVNAAQQGLSYLKLAETNFKNKMYPTAAAYYDSASTKLPASHELYEQVEQKKESLAGLVENLKVIEVQDSLLGLANLSEKQRTRKIREMIEREEEEAERMARMEENNLSNFPTGDDGGGRGGASAIQGGQWYFYNQNLRSSGVRNFRNRFGNRELEDNWRRKEKQRITEFDDGSGEAPAEGDLTTEVGEAGASAGEKLEKYLADIPKSEEEIQQSHDKIITAYLNIGNIYKNDLKDLYASERQLKELLERYPDLEQKGRVWYTLYRINVTMEDSKDADHYKNLILNELPDSDYARLIEGKQTGEQDTNLLAKAHYKETYKSFKEGKLEKSLRMADSGLSAFASSEHAPQFMLIKAYSLGHSGKKEKMEEVLEALVKKHGGTEQGKEAQRILNHISTPAAGEDGGTMAGAESPGESGDAMYNVNKQDEHKYLVIVPNTKGLVNNVTIDIIDHNKKFFKNLNLNTKSIYINPEEQMVLVSGLPNYQKAKQYFNLMKQQNVLEKNLKTNQIKHFVISNPNFNEVYKEKDFGKYLDFFNEHYPSL